MVCDSLRLISDEQLEDFLENESVNNGLNEAPVANLSICPKLCEIRLRVAKLIRIFWI